jgi:hypothetical protein
VIDQSDQQPEYLPHRQQPQRFRVSSASGKARISTLPWVNYDPWKLVRLLWIICIMSAPLAVWKAIEIIHWAHNVKHWIAPAW